MQDVKTKSTDRHLHLTRGRARQILLLLAMLGMARAIVSGGVITGTIYDEETGEPVSFATVRVEGTGRSMLANENGEYRLYMPEGRYQLKFSHVAHYSEQLSVSAFDTVVVQDVYLHPAIIQVPGMKVYERAYDPAQKIILEAIARKEEILARIHAYSFEAYSKLVVRDTTKDDSSDIMVITESQLTSHWEYPHKYKEIVFARRHSSNLQGAEVLTAIGELTNFNQNRLDFGEFSVVSPTARDALDYYNYYLLDTICIDSQAVFRLEIEPKSTSDPLFAGTIDIVDSTFAVVGVDVGFNEAFDIPYVVDARYSEHYSQFKDEYWMPIEIRFWGIVEISLPGVPTMSFDYVVALHNFTFNTAHPKGTFDEYWIEVAEDADDVDSTGWNTGQLIPLTPEEIRGYQRIDSIVNAPKPLPKRLLRLGLGAAYFGCGGNYDLFHFNRVEGAYLGGAYTLRKFLPRTKLRLKSGYAFSGEYWQHNYGFTYTISNSQKLTIGGEYHDEIRRRPTIISSQTANPTLMSLANKTDPFDYYLERGFHVSLTSKVVNRTKLTVAYQDYNQYSASNNTEYSLFRESKKNRTNPGIIDGKLRLISGRLSYDSRPQWKYKGDERIYYSASYVLFALGAEVASPKFIDNDFDFVRYYVWLYRRQRILGLGVSRIELCAGASDITLPPQKYFTVDFGAGLLEGETYFKTLGEKNFSGSRALAVYVNHDFGRVLFRKSGLPLVKDIPFALSIHGGAFWTDFKNHPAQPGDGDIRLARKPYSEVGFGLGRITPLYLKLYFTWQLSGYSTNSFSWTIGGGF
jgi:hypothetical protein